MQSSLFAVGVMEIQTESFARQVSPESFELGCRGCDKPADAFIAA
jgi:hypothetical protein